MGVPPDVVYVAQPGDNHELRYSLRSLVNVPHGRVWIVSDTLPEWATNVGLIPVGDDWFRVRNVVEKLYAAAVHPEVSELFQFWNDDFFALQPAAAPVRFKGVADPQPCRQPPNMTGRQAVRWTNWMLSHHWKIDPVFDYEGTHTPLPVVKSDLKDVVDHARNVGMEAPAVRTLYGNLCQIGGTEGVNVKAYKHADRPNDETWVSTSPQSWAGVTGKLIRGLFPELSPYERP